MTDPTTDQTIRTAFAALRAEEQPRVIPPGTDAAHRTVRRRRRLRLATAGGGVAAAALLAAGYLTGPGQLDRAPEVVHSRAPAATLSRVTVADLADPDLQELARLTAEALGGGSEKDILLVSGDVRETAPPDGDLVEVLGVITDEAGRLLLRVSCGGAGSLEVIVRAGDDEANTTVRCGTTAAEITDGIGEADLVVDRDEEIQITVVPDQAAADHQLRVISFALVPQR